MIESGGVIEGVYRDGQTLLLCEKCQLLFPARDMEPVCESNREQFMCLACMKSQLWKGDVDGNH